MLYNPARRDSSLDQALLWSALLLGAIGLVMVYSASVAMADAERFTGFRPGYFLVRHGAYIAVGLAVGAVLFKVPLWLWQKASPWLFMIGTGFLVFVLIPAIGREVGQSVSGSRSAGRKAHTVTLSATRALITPPVMNP